MKERTRAQREIPTKTASQPFSTRPVRRLSALQLSHAQVLPDVLTSLFQQIAQSGGVGAALYLGQGCELYLTDTLAGDVETFPDLFEGLGLAAGKAESVLEDHPLAFGEAAERLAHAGLQEGGLGQVVGRFRLLIRYKVTQLRGVVLPDRGLQGDRTPRYAPDAYDLLGVDLHDGGHLFVRGVAVELGAESALDPVVLVDLLDHVHRDPDRTSFVGYRPGDGLTDPPRRVGRELEALAVVELLDGPHQPDVALLDQIEQRDAPSGILLRDGDDEPEVGFG